jgi:carboxyl-terminal processing protease
MILRSIITVLCLLPFFLYGQSNVCSKTASLISEISKYHVEPRPVDHEFSNRVVENLFSTLDPYGLYFTRSEITNSKLGEINFGQIQPPTKSCEWLIPIEILFEKRKEEYKAWIGLTLMNPVDFKRDEFFDIRPTQMTIAANHSQLEDNRRKYIKYQLLTRMSEEMLRDSTKDVREIEPQVRKKVLAKEREMTDNAVRKEGGIRQFIEKAFLKSIATSFDPHTDYLTSDENQDFISSLSAKQQSFGFSLAQNAVGNYLISAIIPGGPAWDSNDFQEGDILLSIEAPGQPVMQLADYSIEEIAELLSLQAISEATFIVKKPTGGLKQAHLKKKELESIENKITAFVLQGSKTIGYIPLPSFYSNWDESFEPKNGCATDVAKAIVKLKKENLDGLILDLRYNGGGSLGEALDLAGIFIDYGPLAVFKESGKPIEVLKDQNRGTIYNGPLIIMINGFSASASELLAATLQDYNRALIVGSKTFGKGTGQNVLPLNNATKDFLKVTSLKIYRINGKTYQLNGVRPSIELPDITRFFSWSESHYSFPLANDSVNKKTYYTALTPIDASDLVKRSQDRIATSECFSTIQTLANLLESPIPLHAQKFMDYVNAVTSLQPKLKTKTFSVIPPKADEALNNMSTFNQQLNSVRAKEIEESFYIHETYSIMIDYLNAKQKK